MKKLFQNLSIHRKMTVIVVLTTLVAMILSAVVILFWQEISLTRFVVKELEATAEILGTNGAAALRFKVAQDARKTLSSIKAKTHIIGARFYDEKKKKFAEYSRDGAPLNVSEFPLTEGHIFTFSRVILVKHIYHDDDFIGIIQIVSDLDDLYGHLIEAIFAAVLIILISSSLTILFSFKFLHTISDPISNLLSTANEISRNKDYHQRARIFADDDLGKLTAGFNNMLQQIELRDAELQRAHGELEKQLSEQKKAEERIKDYAEELERYRDGLEEMVSKKTEDLENAKRVAEQANQAKSEFLSRMSHELRTPLNAILGFGQLMVMDSMADSPKEKSHPEYIVKAGKHLLELVNKVLDLSRIETREFHFSKKNIAVSSSIQEILILNDSSMEENNIKVITPLFQKSDLFVWADHTAFRQIMLNLISNAVKYNKPGGSITLDGGKTDDNKVWISVSDTGQGIPEEKIAALFEPFNRLGQEYGGIEGTGIGLSICKSLVQQMDGSISVESSLGEGCCFKIELPVGKEESDNNREIISSMPPGSDSMGSKNYKFLYIEDDLANLELVLEVLKARSQIHCLSATNPNEGIELARIHQPDLILMDINLPEMDGITAFKKLQQFKQTKDIPVIALTALAMGSDELKAMSAGFKGYITKPIDIPSFLEKIDDFLP